MLSPCHLHQNPTCPKCGQVLYRNERRRAIPRTPGEKYVTYSCQCGWNGGPESLRLINVKRRLQRIEEGTDNEWTATLAFCIQLWDGEDVEKMEKMADYLEISALRRKRMEGLQ